MTIRRIAAALLMLAVPVVGHSNNETQARLQETACWFEIPEHRQAKCAWFYPGDSVLGVSVRLPVVRIPGNVPAASNALPLLYIPGGPGYPAGLDQAGMRGWWYWRDVSRWPGDLWLFDPRGTGRAQPAIDCPGMRASDRAMLASAPTADAEMGHQAETGLACYQALGGKRVLQKFNSQHLVRDIKKLLAVSKVRNWNLWGVSWGTRVAMQLLRSPELPVRSVVLDSAYPPGINGFLQKPAQFTRALEFIVASCDQRPECANANPDTAEKIDTLLTQVESAPVNLEYLTADGLEPIEVKVTGLRLLWMLFLDSYLTQYETDTASAVAAAVAGKPDAVEPMARRFVNTLLDPGFSPAVYFSASCSEDWPTVTRSKFDERMTKYPRLLPYLKPDWKHAVCRFWDAGKLPAAFSQPPSSNVPVLLLSGQFDPATPAQWSRTAAKNMKNAKHLIFRGASHTVTFNNQCAMRSAAKFLESPADWKPPDCLQQEQVILPESYLPESVK